MTLQAKTLIKLVLPAPIYNDIFFNLLKSLENKLPLEPIIAVTSPDFAIPDTSFKINLFCFYLKKDYFPFASIILSLTTTE